MKPVTLSKSPTLLGSTIGRDLECSLFYLILWKYINFPKYGSSKLYYQSLGEHGKIFILLIIYLIVTL